MQDFKKLAVWKKSHALVLEVYATTALFPNNELFGLVAQMRRAAVSIPANLAEGSSRGGDKEFAHFLRIASASASELEYFLVLAADLGYFGKPDAVELIARTVEARRMLSGLIASLALPTSRGRTPAG